MTDLRALAERLEKATGADREVDLRLHLAFFQSDATDIHNDGAGLRWRDARGTIRHLAFHAVDSYTKSLDAAVALCERVLPGVVWIVRGNADLVRGHKAEAYLSRFAIDRFRDVGNPESHFTPALALCLAVVRAKLAEPE